MSARARFSALSLLALLLAAGYYGWAYYKSGFLTAGELRTARSLSLSSLPDVPVSPGNAVAADPRAVALGAALFSDTGLSANNAVSCASCHDPDKEFQDGLPLGQAIGTTARRTMPLQGAAWQSWFFWDGRKDSLWSQALGPMESAVEHGFTRTQISAYVTKHYSAQYVGLFGSAPDLSGLPAASPLGNKTQAATWRGLSPDTQARVNRVFANVGKVIAAYERTLLPQENRFDRYVAAISAGKKTGVAQQMSRLELDGFRVFTSNGHCMNCHNGPLLSDGFFHNTAVPSPVDPPIDHGRGDAISAVLGDPFNCLGPYSDAVPGACRELQFMLRDPKLFERSYKTPTLRGVAGRPPYMHAGQFATLERVIEHYNRPHRPPSGHREINRLRLSWFDKMALLAFLRTL